MTQQVSVSVVVNNYNYGRFVGDAIDSVLGQSRAASDLIVVDDGSTDESRDVIASYGDRLDAVFKENGGQASALNAGYRRATGNVLVFLDADDMLLPNAIERIVAAFEDGPVVKVHWPLEVVSEDGRRIGQLTPRSELPSGDLRPSVSRYGPGAVVSPPMSGNAFSRTLLGRIMPIPEPDFRLCADEYLYDLAPFFGEIGRVRAPLALYRLHGRNNYSSKTFEQRLEYATEVHSRMFEVITSTLARLEMPLDPRDWKPRSWFLEQGNALKAIEQVVPRDCTFILVDEDQWGADETVAGRTRLPFLERDGLFWGPPEDDDQAIAELERLRAAGARAIVFVSSTFWWLDHYRGFARHLRDRYRCATSSDDVTIFDLDRPIR